LFRFAGSFAGRSARSTQISIDVNDEIFQLLALHVIPNDAFHYSAVFLLPSAFSPYATITPAGKSISLLGGGETFLYGFGKSKRFAIVAHEKSMSFLPRLKINLSAHAELIIRLKGLIYPNISVSR
jgi:hypothetical protein